MPDLASAQNARGRNSAMAEDLAVQKEMHELFKKLAMENGFIVSAFASRYLAVRIKNEPYLQKEAGIRELLDRVIAKQADRIVTRDEEHPRAISVISIEDLKPKKKRRNN